MSDEEQSKTPLYLAIFVIIMVFGIVIFAVVSDMPSVSPNPNLNGSPIIQTQDNFLLSCDNLDLQDVTDNITVSFSFLSGNFSGQGNLNFTTEGGLFLIMPSSSGTLNITCTSPNFYPYINSTILINPYKFSSGSPFTVYWIYSTT